MNRQDKLIQKIIGNKNNYIFVSPHLDDAIFSAGALIDELRNYGNLSIVTVFTKASESPYTLSAKKYLGTCGLKDANVLYARRRNEDNGICREIGIKCKHLGFTDALFRKKNSSNLFSKLIPELIHTYPFYRKMFGASIITNEVPEIDRDIIGKIANILQREISQNTIVFCPLGIGGHVDHLITKEAIESIKNCKIAYYCDTPYVYKNKISQDEINKKNLRKISCPVNTIRKQYLIEKYATQAESVFRGIKLEKWEKYYITPMLYESLK